MCAVQQASMQEAWIAFAKTGNPSCASTGDWAPYCVCVGAPQRPLSVVLWGRVGSRAIIGRACGDTCTDVKRSSRRLSCLRGRERRATFVFGDENTRLSGLQLAPYEDERVFWAGRGARTTPE